MIDGTTLKLADFGFARSCLDPTALQPESSSHTARVQIEEFRSRKVSVLHTSDPNDEDHAFREMRRRSHVRHSAAAQLARIPPDRSSGGSLRSKSRTSTLTSNKRQRRTSQSTTKSTSFCGSVAYASPEVVAGEQYDPTISDMWSCGVILYILMMGKMPFDDSHPRKMLRRQRTKKYLEKVRGVLSEQCINLMESLMEPSPNKRITVDDALLHTWLRPTYKSILQKLIAHEKRAYRRKTLPTKLVDQQEVVRNMTLCDATKKLVQIDKCRGVRVVKEID
ncbi:hypothetical protein RvY_07621 [Ramazzottius varieornatus]|uniref:Protein kinase domain-containing protein n=1 Tax=Ramazzottius varieornatus TaxID=947166 RepID=A0A1D1VB85_RAMVA|nr:hypothetical protein RvY_07621 [Ramazzottius varieornatus]